MSKSLVLQTLFAASAFVLSAHAFAQQTATPAFSIPAGQYNSSQTVAISDATPGAKIYYTRNGSTPTTSSTPYLAPIAVRSTETLSAIAVAKGFSASTALSATYTLVAANPVFSVPGGAYGTVQTVSISSATPTAFIFYSTNGGYPTPSALKYSTPLTLANSARVCAVAYETGFTSSANVCQTYVINAHPAIPTFSLRSGSYNSSQTAAIQDATPGATMYYTTDGSTPSILSTPYTGPITVDRSQILSAIAIAPPLYPTPSAVGSASYVFKFIYTVAGNGNPPSPDGGSESIGDGGPAFDALFYSPSSVAFDKVGNLYIADTADNRIREISATTGIITSVAGIGPIGLAGSYSGDGGPAIDAGIDYPIDLAFDSKGNLYFIDGGNNAIRRIDARTSTITTFANGTNKSRNVGLAMGLAFDSQDNLYVSAGDNFIRKVAASTGVVSTFAGSTYSGGCQYSGDGGPALAATLCAPQKLTFDSTDNLYFADAGNQVVRKISQTTGTITTVIGTNVHLIDPVDVAVRPNGDVYVSDPGRGQVLRLNAATGTTGGFAGLGSNAIWQDGISPSLNTLFGPNTIVFDRFGNAYILMGEYPAVRVVSLAPTSDPGLVGMILH